MIVDSKMNRWQWKYETVDINAKKFKKSIEINQTIDFDSKYFN